MRSKGISYDTGFISNGALSRVRFDLDEVERELRIIRDDLHGTAVRVVGGDSERLERATTVAADLGLEVWFSPYPLELTAEEMLSLFADCAERIGELSTRVNDFLATAVRVVRERFGGKVTYAAIPLERVDWELFDIIGMDLYRSAEVADQFAAGVRTLVAQGKPVAITEFGTAAYRDAGERGGRVLEVVEYSEDTGAPLRLTGEFVRDSFPHRRGGDPRDDLDLASLGIVKVLENRRGDTYPGLPWESKAAFTALGEYYRG
ncbi:hypothetical protein [Nocardia sp. MW-W600-9]